MSEKYIARNSFLACRTLEGGLMVMSPYDSTFFTFNEAAAIIWQAADGMTPLSEIVANKICAVFEVDHKSARKDTEKLVEELSVHGVLIVSKHPINAFVPSAVHESQGPYPTGSARSFSC